MHWGANLLIAIIWIAAIVFMAAVLWLLADADEWVRLQRIRESKRPSDTSHNTPWGDVVELPAEARISHHVRERSE
jgi:hypothetical protein